MTEKKDINEMIKKLQQIQQQLQVLMFQKQNVQVQQAEVENALKEVESGESTDLYEIIGTVMIKRDRDGLLKSLKEKNEILELRLSTLDKQINNLSGSAKKLQDEVISLSKEKKK
jgi:prefoldin beta subunit